MNDHVIVCIYGVLGRGFVHTREYIHNNILDILTKNGIPYKVILINNNVGSSRIDNMFIDNDQSKTFPHDAFKQIDQQHMDIQIHRDHPKLQEYFKSNYKTQTKINAARNSYIEMLASEELIKFKNHRTITMCGDVLLEKPIDLSWLSCNTHEVVIPWSNPCDGYPNGFYVGACESVSKLVNHYHMMHDIHHEKDYEHLLLQTAKKNKINIKHVDCCFIKIRADGLPNTFDNNGRYKNWVRFTKNPGRLHDLADKWLNRTKY